MRNFHRFINVVKRPHFKSGIGYLKISQESLDDPQYRNENSGLKYEFFKDDNAESPNTESIDIFVLFSELEEHEKFVVNIRGALASGSPIGYTFGSTWTGFCGSLKIFITAVSTGKNAYSSTVSTTTILEYLQIRLTASAACRSASPSAAPASREPTKEIVG